MFVLFSEVNKETVYFCTLFQELVLLIVLFQAGLSDLERGKIPNIFIITGFIFIFPFFLPEIIFEKITGGLVLGVFFLIIWKLGLIGGGDVKLIALTALVKGADKALLLIVISFTAATIINGFGLLFKGILYERFESFFDYIRDHRKIEESYVDIACRNNEGIPLAAYMFFSDLLILAYSGLRIYQMF